MQGFHSYLQVISNRMDPFIEGFHSYLQVISNRMDPFIEGFHSYLQVLWNRMDPFIDGFHCSTRFQSLLQRFNLLDGNDVLNIKSIDSIFKQGLVALLSCYFLMF